MKGSVDRFGRAVVEVLIRPTTKAEAVPLLAWVDTAFNGELVISQTTIDHLGLPQSAGIEATLADGRKYLLESYSCVIDWFGQDRPVEVSANEGELPLLGVALLIGHRLVVDDVERTLAIE